MSRGQIGSEATKAKKINQIKLICLLESVCVSACMSVHVMDNLIETVCRQIPVPE